MANEQGNDSPDRELNHPVDGVASLSITSPSTAFEDKYVGDKSAGSTSSSSARETNNTDSFTSSVQSPLSRPLWKTLEGRIAGYKRMIESNHLPEQRANFEAMIRYYEDGCKVPEGEEEVWAFDGQASFGVRFYTHIDQMPDGWLSKHRWRDVRRAFCLCRYCF